MRYHCQDGIPELRTCQEEIFVLDEFRTLAYCAVTMSAETSDSKVNLRIPASLTEFHHRLLMALKAKRETETGRPCSLSAVIRTSIETEAKKQRVHVVSKLDSTGE